MLSRARGDDVVQVVVKNWWQQLLRNRKYNFIGDRVKSKMRITCQ